MTSDQLLILIQNIILIFLIACPSWILCKSKKKGVAAPDKPASSNTLQVKSGIKPASVSDPTPSQAVVPKEEKKEEAAAPVKESGSKTPEKKEDEKAGGEEKASQKKFPTFVMPTESIKKKKEKEVEQDKKQKINEGFYQPKSDDDDTLEKIQSLEVEKSDKTKRSAKNKKK